MRGRHRQTDVEQGDVPAWALISVTSAAAALAVASLASSWLVGVLTNAVEVLATP